MSRKPFLECSFFIPIRRDANLSDGDFHSRRALTWLDDELFERFEGGTIAPGFYDGFYKDPDTGERISDQSYRYLVAIPTSNIDELRALLAQACIVFQQKCIYLSVGGKVEFVRGAKNELS